MDQYCRNQEIYSEEKSHRSNQAKALSASRRAKIKELDYIQSEYYFLNEVSEQDSDDKVELTLRYKEDYEGIQPFVKPFSEKILEDQFVHKIFYSIVKGFNGGLQPLPLELGVSGNYIFKNENKIGVAIFKPFDEEAYAPNNPKGYRGRLGGKSFRDGILSGESASREVAAYLLDRKGVHRVPETFYVEVYHPHFEKPLSDHFKQQGVDDS